MAGTGAGYDLSVTTFSPDGRVFQVEYADKAVGNSGTAIAICCKDGIIFAVEKLLGSKMLVKGSAKRVFPIHKRAGMCIAGLVADSRQLVNRARSEANNYNSSYGEEIPPAILAERLGMYTHAHTLYWSVRPFCCAVLMGCIDEESKTPSLFMVEPSGLVYKYKGNAIGKGKQAAKTEIEKLMANENLTCEQALVDVAKIIHKVHDEKDREFELEMSWICPQSNYQMRMVPEALVKTSEDEAKKRIEAEEEED